VGREPTEGWHATRLAIRETARRIVCIVDIGGWGLGLEDVGVSARSTFPKRK